ncbi:hypothetical protein Fcan01_24936, partial [Folsomia candida]
MPVTRSQAEGGEPAVDKQQEDKNGSFFGRLGGFFAGAPIRSPDGSVSSGSGSVKSAIARRNAALAQVAGFKEEKKQQVYQCELELNDLEADLCEMEDKLDTANKKLVALDPCAQDEESTALKEECQQLKKSIRLKTLQVQRKKIKLRKIQDEIEELPEQKKLLESVLDEMEEQTLSDEDDQAEVRKEWAEKRLSLPSVSKSYDDLVQRFTQLQQPFRIDEEVKASREMEKSLESKEKGDHQDGDKKTKVAYAMCPVEVKDDKQFNGRFQQQRNKQSDDERIYSADTSEVKNQKSSSKNCVICDKSGHVQRDCFKFKKMTISDRRQEAMKKRLCYNCLGIRHDSRNCRSSQQCGVDGCKSKHHCLLHISSNRPVETKAESTSESVESVHSFAEPSSSKTGGRRGILGIVKVKLSGPKGTTEVYALVDPGSTTGLIDEKVANQIGLKGPSISICIK